MTTLAGWDGEGNWGKGWTSSRDAVAIVEGVALDAITVPGPGVVDCKSFASSAISVDIIEARDADAGKGVEIEDLVLLAYGSANCILLIVVVWLGAVGADSLH